MSNSQILVGGNPAVVAPVFGNENGGGSASNQFTAIAQSNIQRRLAVVTPGTGGAATARQVLSVEADGSACCGFVVGTTSPTVGIEYVLAGDTATVQFAGELTAPIAEWSLIGASGGLSKGSIYYVSQSTFGHITDIGPTSSEFSVVVGLALSSETMLIQIAPPVLVP